MRGSNMAKWALTGLVLVFFCVVADLAAATTYADTFVNVQANHTVAVTFGMKGDLNNDGRIDVQDVILCLRMAVGLDKKDLVHGDMNSDGDIDVADVIVILSKVVQGDVPSGMVVIPAGEFLMGSPAGEGYDEEHPQHKVYVDAFFMDTYEVTNSQYAKFLNDYGKNTDDAGQQMIYENAWGVRKVGGKWEPQPGYENHPVVYVTWYGAAQYAKFYGKRLPTEAEWEKACRAGSTGKWCFGDDESQLGEYAWYSVNSGGTTHPVGGKKANAYGLYDMHGNVWEWCADWYGGAYYASSPYQNPQGPVSGEYRVLRGGSWYGSAVGCRSAYRSRADPASWIDDVLGFRCAVSGTQ